MASYLLEKSSKNLDAAKLLIAQSHFPSSVHCSYYSCFQLLKHLLLTQFNFTEDSLKTELDRKRAAKEKDSGLHEFAIRTIGRDIFLKNGRTTDYSDFDSKIRDLKHFRVESDYLNREVKIDKSKQAFQYAVDIKTILTKRYGI